MNKKKVREERWKAQDGHCFYCHRVFKDANGGSLDHRIPVSAAGRDFQENLVFSCHSCNARKSNKPEERFIAEQLTKAYNILASHAVRQYLRKSA